VNNVLGYQSSLRSRIPVILTYVFILATLAIGTVVRGGLDKAWMIFGIPALKPYFADTRGITHAIDCLLSGQNPYYVNTFDPWHRYFNYPPIWLSLRHLGVTSATSNLLGTLFGLLMASACIFLFRAKTLLSAAIVFFTLTTWSVLFALERGNNDQVIFASLIFGLVFIERQRPERRLGLTGLLIVLLTVLKIYPFVASVLFLGRRKGIIKALATAAIAIAALVLTSGSNLPRLLRNTPRETHASFGAIPLVLSLRQTITRHYEEAPLLHHAYLASIGAVLVAILAAGFAWKYGEFADRLLPRLDLDRARGQFAVAGLAIYSFAFLSGSSFDYRLIYLLGAQACLVDEINGHNLKRALPAAILLILAMAGGMRLSFHHEIADGLTFVLACAWLGRTIGRQTAEAAPPFSKANAIAIP